MLRPDLHIHTTASDGVLTPSKVVLRANEHGVNLLAVSDHDSLDGIAEAQAVAVQAGIRLISAVEFSCSGEAEVHVLGYGLTPASEEISRVLAHMKREREGRAAKILSRLETLGIHLEDGEIPAAPNAVKGRAQIARALLAKGCVQSMQEAFERLIGVGCPAYVPREKLHVTDAVKMILAHGGIPVLAHPGLLKMDTVAFNALFGVWQEAGLKGVEVYHPAHRPHDFAYWDQFARSRGMLVTGGSDFHEAGDKHADIGEMLGFWPNAHADAQRLLDALEIKKGKMV